MMDFDELDELEEQAQAADEAKKIEAPGGSATGAATQREVPYEEFMDEYWGLLTDKVTTGKVEDLYHVPGPPADAAGATDSDFEARRIVAQSNRESMANVEIKPLPPFKKFTKPEIEKVANNMLNGDMYGLPIPPTLGELQKLGASWLTDALHAAGTLPSDNAITKVVDFKRLPMTGQMAAGGTGPKAFITVEYAKPDPELHTELFAKMPWACDGNTKEMGCDPFYRWKVSCNSDYEAQETTVYRFLGPLFPFKIPKYYFADICRNNTNYILITEKIPFGQKDNKEWEPYEILPVAEKYFDFQLEPSMRYEMYYCLMRAQARMAAWDKLKFFDITPPEFRGMAMAPLAPGAFQFPLKLPAKRRQVLQRNSETVCKLWKEFLEDHAKRIYPPEYSDKGFIAALMDCCRDCNAYKDDIQLYSCLFPGMIALQHANLQSDNAYYWRDAEGKMDAGLIDWGGACPSNFAARLSGCLTSAEGEVLDEHEDGLLRCFVDEYYKECGIRLDFYEFRRQWRLNYCLYVASMGVNIEMEIFRETPREEWKTIHSMWHPKAVGRWNVRCYVFMIASALKYLNIRWVRNGKKRLHCHDAFLEWKEYWVGQGMT